MHALLEKKNYFKSLLIEKEIISKRKIFSHGMGSQGMTPRRVMEQPERMTLLSAHCKGSREKSFKASITMTTFLSLLSKLGDSLGIKTSSNRPLVLEEVCPLSLSSSSAHIHSIILWSLTILKSSEEPKEVAWCCCGLI